MTVSRKTAETSDAMQELTIAGEPTKVDYAKQLLDDLLKDEDLNTTVTVPVPSRYVGLVIGRKGENIQRIRKETCTKIQHLDTEGGQMFQILGPLSAVNRADYMIREIMSKAKVAYVDSYDI